jgi:hypothetical protein
LKALTDLDNLTIIDLSENPVAKTANYREEVFKTLPKLEVLDMQYKSGEMYDSEEEDFDGEMPEEADDNDFIEGSDFCDYSDDLDQEEDEDIDKGSKKRRID